MKNLQWYDERRIDNRQQQKPNGQWELRVQRPRHQSMVFVCACISSGRNICAIVVCWEDFPSIHSKAYSIGMGTLLTTISTMLWFGFLYLVYSYSQYSLNPLNIHTWISIRLSVHPSQNRINNNSITATTHRSSTCFLFAPVVVVVGSYFGSVVLIISLQIVVIMSRIYSQIQNHPYLLTNRVFCFWVVIIILFYNPLRGRRFMNSATTFLYDVYFWLKWK